MSGYNQLKNSYIYGTLRNLDYADASQQANAIFDRDVTIEGYTYTKSGLKVLITVDGNTTTYTLTKNQIQMLTNITSDVQNQLNVLNQKCTEITYDDVSDTTTITNFVNITKEMTVNSLIIPLSQLLTINGNIFTNGIAITPTVLSYIANLSSDAQTQITNNTTNITINTNNIATINSALSTYALLNSPNFTGNPTAPTPISTDNSTKIATTAFVKTALDNLIGGASSAYDTLYEIQQALASISSSGGSGGADLLPLDNTFTGTNTFSNINTNIITASGLINANNGLTIPTTKLLTLVGSLFANATTISPTELSYLSGVSSSLQSQLNAKTSLSSIQSNNNVWSGTNTFNTNLPTSTLTPTTSTQLITKSYGDATYAPLSNSYTTLSAVQNNLNTFTTTNNFNGLVNISNLVANRFSPTSLTFPTISDNTGSTGFQHFWNISSGIGETDFLNLSQGSSVGGYSFYTLQTTSTTAVPKKLLDVFVNGMTINSNVSSFTSNTATNTFAGTITNTNTTESTSLTTGSVVLSGGLGVSKNVSCLSVIIGNGTSGSNLIDILQPASSASGTSIRMGVRSFGPSSFNYIFNGANVSSFNNNAIVVRDSGIAYNTTVFNTSQYPGYVICPVLSTSGTAGTRWDNLGNVTNYNTTNLNLIGLTSVSSIPTRNNSEVGLRMYNNMQSMNDVDFVCQSGSLSAGGFAFYTQRTNINSTALNLAVINTTQFAINGNVPNFNVNSGASTFKNDVTFQGDVNIGNGNKLGKADLSITTTTQTLTFPVRDVYFIDGSVSGQTVILPVMADNVNNGCKIIIRMVNSLANAITIQAGSGNTICPLNSVTGVSSITLNSSSASATFVAHTPSWYMV